MRASHRTWTAAALVLATALLAMIAAGVVTNLAEPTRSATAVVALAPNGTPGSSPDTVRLLRGGYADLIGAEEELQDATARLGLERNALADVDVVVPDGANTIEVTVTHAQPAVATEGADALASRLVDVASRQPLLDAEQIVAADDPARVTGVAPAVTIVVAGLFGGLLAVGALLALRTLDPPVRDLATLRALGLPLVARLPGGGDRRLDGPLLRAALEPVVAGIAGHHRAALVGIGVRDLDRLADHLADASGSGTQIITVTRPLRPAGQRQWAEADGLVLVVGRCATRREVAGLRDLIAAVRRHVVGVVAIGLAGALDAVDAAPSPECEPGGIDRLRVEVD